MARGARVGYGLAAKRLTLAAGVGQEPSEGWDPMLDPAEALVYYRSAQPAESADQKPKLVLRTTNGVEIAADDLRTNAYGFRGYMRKARRDKG